MKACASYCYHKNRYKQIKFAKDERGCRSNSKLRNGSEAIYSRGENLTAGSTAQPMLKVATFTKPKRYIWERVSSVNGETTCSEGVFGKQKVPTQVFQMFLHAIITHHLQLQGTLTQKEMYIRHKWIQKEFILLTLFAYDFLFQCSNSTVNSQEFSSLVAAIREKKINELENKINKQENCKIEAMYIRKPVSELRSQGNCIVAFSTAGTLFLPVFRVTNVKDFDSELNPQISFDIEVIFGPSCSNKRVVVGLRIFMYLWKIWAYENACNIKYTWNLSNVEQRCSDSVTSKNLPNNNKVEKRCRQIKDNSEVVSKDVRPPQIHGGIAVLAFLLSNDRNISIKKPTTARCEVQYAAKHAEQSHLVEQMNTKYYYYTRTQGLFRICYPKERPPTVQTYLSPVETHCMNINYFIPDEENLTRGFSDDAMTRLRT
ncbi:hypothetical protein E2986_13019 [Frieseomelitta varia]|uniref:Uncharacterized protein n=1 Tax=Frieseomelitta varia TaxID=561572 RepID=A0A833VXY2_9HYME|nr:hypothetical protein E2986_13019 [Frieseomelitta varia]